MPISFEETVQSTINLLQQRDEALLKLSRAETHIKELEQVLITMKEPKEDGPPKP